jgi:hypothetical protein
MLPKSAVFTAGIAAKLVETLLTKTVYGRKIEHIQSLAKTNTILMRHL